MAKRLNISQPVVLNTEIAPLDESFWIEASGTLQQWYDTTSRTYSPDRTVQGSYLELKPCLSLYDASTGENYMSNSVVGIGRNITRFNFFNITWSVIDKSVSQNEFNVTSTSSSNPYYKDANGYLRVKQNVVDSTNGVLITCRAEYIDPRDSSRSATLTKHIHLTVNKTGEAFFPEIKIDAPSIISYNPFGEQYINETAPMEGMPLNRQPIGYYKLKAQMHLHESLNEEDYIYSWYGCLDNEEEKPLADLPCLASVHGEGVDNVLVDARFCEITKIILRVKKVEDGVLSLLPMEASCTIRAKIPPVDVIVTSNKGDQVSDKNKNFKFGVIVNTNQGNVKDSLVDANLRFNWKKMKLKFGENTASTIEDLGWGRSVVINSEELKNFTQTKNGSTSVWCDVYYCGTYKKVILEDSINGDKEVFYDDDYVEEIYAKSL